jgi:hypothetical protein
MAKLILKKKISKGDAGYIEEENCDYKCDECFFYKEKKCALYGQSVDIKPFGSCILFQKSNGGNEKSWVSSTTKAATDYEENKDGFSCKRCEYFNNGSCKKVAGSISPNGCCNFWEKI